MRRPACSIDAWPRALAGALFALIAVMYWLLR